MAQTGETAGEAERRDHCPYSRSFSASFIENPRCPAFQAAAFTVTDTAERVLGPATTCRHLTVGNDSLRSGRFYPRCGLGDPAQRLSWVATVTPARLAMMRSLEEEFAELIAGDRTALLESKARLLAAGAMEGAQVELLEMQLSAFLDRLDHLIVERRDRLSDIGLPAELLQQVLHDWSLAWLRSRHLFSPAVAEMRLTAFAEPAAAFLGAGSRAGGARADAEILAAAGRLVIERTSDPLTLHLRGDVDVANSDAIATAVSAAIAEAGEVVVDFRDVLFCDLSGLRALVRVAGDCGTEQRIVVCGLPHQLRRALAIVGWADLPNLVVVDGTGVCA
ncbi:MAG: STAS domain-containing protein [Candidatus Dormibacteria bacterium]